MKSFLKKYLILVLLVFSCVCLFFFVKYFSHEGNGSFPTPPQTLKSPSPTLKNNEENNVGVEVQGGKDLIGKKKPKELTITDIENVNNYTMVVEYNGSYLSHYTLVRKNNSGKFELVLVRSFNPSSFSDYPVVSYEDALSIIKKTHSAKDVYTNNARNLMSFRKSNPFYNFTAPDSKKIIGVDAETGAVVNFDRASPTLQELEKKEIEDAKKFLHKYAAIKNGYFELKDTVSELTEKEKLELENTASETNILIRQGLLKFDEDFNVVYDGRNK